MQASEAEALAVDASGRLTAVGSSAAVLALAHSKTAITDLQGAFVTPVSSLAQSVQKSYAQVSAGFATAIHSAVGSHTKYHVCAVLLDSA